MRPSREQIRSSEYSYFISTQTHGRRGLFRVEKWARLMVDVLRHYDGHGYILHAYVVMPDHLHVLLSPMAKVEKAVQLIKGGFSFRAKRELSWNGEVWQPGFTDHRIRDSEDWNRHLEYIRLNPVEARLVEDSTLYEWMNFPKKDFPQGLKPQTLSVDNVRAEARTLQTQPQPDGRVEGMKVKLLVLTVLAGLGSSFSVALPAQSADPFERYEASVKSKVAERSVRQFARECGIDLTLITPTFAESGGDDWIPVKHLMSDESGLATDYFSTAEVWSKGSIVLVEIWNIDGSDGEETRTFRCFRNKFLQQLDAISWNLPQSVSPDAFAWGFEQSWKRDTSGKMRRMKVGFVDGSERRIPEPKLAEDDKQTLDWKPDLGDLDQLKLPTSSLK